MRPFSLELQNSQQQCRRDIYWITDYTRKGNKSRRKRRTSGNQLQTLLPQETRIIHRKNETVYLEKHLLLQTQNYIYTPNHNTASLGGIFYPV